jgi:putative hydrolase of the HAD superfamily
MTIKAVSFDIGGVLEKVGDLDEWLAALGRRHGIDQVALEAGFAAVDPRNLIGTGDMTEAEFRAGTLDAFGFTNAETDDFMTRMWDWYCGELDSEMFAFAEGLRPAYRTGIISNSADGARREEQARYRFEQLVDDIVYSHEVGLVKPDPKIYELACERLGVAPDELVFIDDTQICVDGAAAVGIHAVLHESTPTTIARVNALLSGGGDVSAG